MLKKHYQSLKPCKCHHHVKDASTLPPVRILVASCFLFFSSSVEYHSLVWLTSLYFLSPLPIIWLLPPNPSSLQCLTLVLRSVLDWQCSVLLLSGTLSEWLPFPTPFKELPSLEAPCKDFTKAPPACSIYHSACSLLASQVWIWRPRNSFFVFVFKERAQQQVPGQ